MTTEDRSWSWREGCSVARQIIVGTVAQIFTPSRSIRENTFSGSKRPSGITSFMPPMNPTTRVECGRDVEQQGGQQRHRLGAVGDQGRLGPGEGGERQAEDRVLQVSDHVAVVLIAPLGRPVVPEV
ncbi:MAG: hypothetical protein R2716_07690 [Microthrixaceae bacterium]